MKNGAHLEASCVAADICVRSYQRWKKGDVEDKRKGAEKNIPRKLSAKEENEIKSICCSNEYKDANPYDIFISLLDKSKYIASISTFYRVLRKFNLLKHRSNRKAAKKKSKPIEVKATGPNQVWCWDITWLKSAVKGMFFFAYMIIDIWDKSIVGWAIHEEESSEHSATLYKDVLKKENNPKVHIHSDNGKPMKALNLLALFYDLGIKNSFSRPRVSNDNPFIESFFGTMKSRINYPGHFEDIQEALSWMADFVNWYNNQHKHSGINYFTPAQMRSGEFITLAKQRSKTMMNAYEANPSRWSRKCKQWSDNHTVILNPSLDTQHKIKKVA